MNTVAQLGIAARLESLVRRAEMFGPKTREEILEEIAMIAEDIYKRVEIDLDEMATYFGQER